MTTPTAGSAPSSTGTGTVPANPLARNPTAMPVTYHLMVKQSTLADLTGGQFVYRLQVTVR